MKYGLNWCENVSTKRCLLAELHADVCR
jgi:hypothetical protein